MAAAGGEGADVVDVAIAAIPLVGRHEVVVHGTFRVAVEPVGPQRDPAAGQRSGPGRPLLQAGGVIGIGGQVRHRSRRGDQDDRGRGGEGIVDVAVGRSVERLPLDFLAVGGRLAQAVLDAVEADGRRSIGDGEEDAVGGARLAVLAEEAVRAIARVAAVIVVTVAVGHPVGVGGTGEGVDRDFLDREVDPVGAASRTGRVDAVGEIDRVVERLLLHVGQEQDAPRPVVPAEIAVPPRQPADDVVVIVDGDADLLQVVDALRAPGGLARGLDGGQQQRDQNGDDRDHHQQFDQGETSASRFTHGQLLSCSRNDTDQGRKTATNSKRFAHPCMH